MTRLVVVPTTTGSGVQTGTISRILLPVSAIVSTIVHFPPVVEERRPLIGPWPRTKALTDLF